MLFRSIISDFLTENADSAAKKLLYSGQSISFVHILSKDEESPGLGQKLRLVDSETNEYRDLEITSEVAANYRQSLTDFKAGVKAACERLGGLYVFSTTDQNPLSVVKKFI